MPRLTFSGVFTPESGLGVVSPCHLLLYLYHDIKLFVREHTFLVKPPHNSVRNVNLGLADIRRRIRVGLREGVIYT